MSPRKSLLIFLLLALPLVAGSQCAFFFSSGGGSSDDDDPDEKKGLVVVVTQGQLSDPPVAGVGYESGSVVGVTGSEGEFSYEPDKAVRFFIGDITLGTAHEGKPLVTLPDLVENGAVDTEAVINIARLLQSLDSDPTDEIITIPAEVRSAAVSSNEALSWAIKFMDYSDQPAFANAASQLVAVLTREYPFTAVLVEADDAREYMQRSIDR